MKKTLACALLATSGLMVAAAAEPAEYTTICLGGGAFTTAIQLPTRSMLEGQTVKVWFFTEDAHHSKQTLEPEPVTQKFTATAITESLGAESYRDDITWEGTGWCRFDTKSSLKKCFGLTAFTLDPRKGWEVLHVEIDPDQSQFCKAKILGKVEGATVPDGLIPVPQTGTRRR